MGINVKTKRIFSTHTRFSGWWNVLWVDFGGCFISISACLADSLCSPLLSLPHRPCSLCAFSEPHVLLLVSLSADFPFLPSSPSSLCAAHSVGLWDGRQTSGFHLPTLFNWSPADPDFLFINHYSSGTHSGPLWGVFTQRISFFRRTVFLPYHFKLAAIF